MMSGGFLLDAVVNALATSAITPTVEKVVEEARPKVKALFSGVQAAQAARALPMSGIMSTGWESLSSALHRFERDYIRPIGETIQENPCEAQLALYLSTGVGDPRVIARCMAQKTGISGDIQPPAPLVQPKAPGMDTTTMLMLLGGAALIAYLVL